MELFLTGLAAFAVGALVSYFNYLISRAAFRKGGGALGAAATLRSALSVALLVAAYFIGRNTPFSVYALLIGAALGLTAGIAVFTALLYRSVKKYGAEAKTEETENNEGKE